MSFLKVAVAAGQSRRVQVEDLVFKTPASAKLYHDLAVIESAYLDGLEANKAKGVISPPHRAPFAWPQLLVSQHVNVVHSVILNFNMIVDGMMIYLIICPSYYQLSYFSQFVSWSGQVQGSGVV